MIRLPQSLSGCTGGTLRAGGVDLMERRRSGIAGGDVVDLRDLPGLSDVTVDPVDGGLGIGARVTIAGVAADPRVVAGWPGVAKAAGALATPEIRAVATLGGNLAQHTRCWYYRNPAFACLKKGGATCYAHDGENIWHGIFPTSPCASVHASTMACALLTYDTLVEVRSAALPGASAEVEAEWGRALRSIPELLGDGHDPTRHNALAAGEVITVVHLPPPTPGEKTAYHRAISRARAEWPLIEVSVRTSSAGVRIAVGAVANVPMRLVRVEDALNAGESVEQAVRRAAEGANPLLQNAYKVDLLPNLIRATLEMAS